MSTAYSRNYVPPAPYLPVIFGLPGEQPVHGPYDGFVDSGADISIVPRQLLIQWGIPARVEARVRGQWSASRTVLLYALDLRVTDIHLPGIYVVGDDEGDEIVLGRNVLNKIALLLDGPNLQTDVLNPAQVRRLRAQRGSG